MSEKDSIRKLLDGGGIVVCCGTSGAGKSTVALSLGSIALNRGKRPLIITTTPINPFDNLRPFIKKVDAPYSFNMFLKTICADSAAYEALIKNPLYKSIITAFTGSKEYAILLELYYEWERGKNDLYIVDLPFSENPCNILDSKERITGLFESNALKWILPDKTKFTLPSIIKTGKHALILKIMGHLAGKNLLDEVRDFFSHMQGISYNLLDIFKKADRLIKSQRFVSYIVVTNPFKEAAYTTEWIIKRLKRKGIIPSVLIINKIRSSIESFESTNTSTSVDQAHVFIKEENRIITSISRLVNENTKILFIPFLPSPLQLQSFIYQTSPEA